MSPVGAFIDFGRAIRVAGYAKAQQFSRYKGDGADFGLFRIIVFIGDLHPHHQKFSQTHMSPAAE